MVDAPLERAGARRSGDSNYCIPTEPETSEFYLDTLSVSPRSVPELWHHRMALLVEVEHAAAKRLYERRGFCTDYTKRIAGQEYFHMVRGL